MVGEAARKVKKSEEGEGRSSPPPARRKEARRGSWACPADSNGHPPAGLHKASCPGGGAGNPLGPAPCPARQAKTKLSLTEASRQTHVGPKKRTFERLP